MQQQTQKDKRFTWDKQAQRTSCLYKSRVLGHFEKLLQTKALEKKQAQALSYTLKSGGKSLRANLCYFTAQSLGLRLTQVDDIALATELAHTYSLIHDDLPSMDDDSFRRHRPSHHKAFNEAASILTGDALQAEAFYVLSHSKELNNSQKVHALKELSRTLSSEHLIQGQWKDLFTPPATCREVEFIHLRKTGDLFSFVLTSTAFLKYGEKYQDLFYQLGQQLGLAFQIQDDIFDAQGNFATLGKLSSSDNKHGEQKGVTQFLTIDKAEEKIQNIKKSLSTTIEFLGMENTLLPKLIFGKILTL